MTPDALALTVYFGEHDRRGGRLTSDLLLDVLGRHEVEAAILLRATEGFGIKHRLHTQRILTLSEDLPLVVRAVDEPATVERLLPEVEALVDGGLFTLERARLLTRLEDVAPPGTDGTAVKLTLFLGRRERVERRPAYAFAVDALRRHGVAGATVLLGVDGLLHRDRKRARLLSRNADVPLAVLSVGTSASISTALEELVPRLDDPLAVLELVRVCKRDGRLLEEPPVPPREDAAGLGVWQKLTVVAAEHARHGRHPLYVELIHRLRLAGAAGATAVRGIWGYSGDHAPHGDSLTALRRRVPVVLTVIDRPDRMGAWWPLVDEVTSEHGLVTSELVPAFRAVGPGIEAGGLRLARPAG